MKGSKIATVRRPLKILIFVLAILILGIIVLCVMSFDCENIPKSLTTITNSATCVTASLTVIFTVFSMEQTRKNRQTDKLRESRRTWYRDIVLDRYLSEIKLFFDSCENLLPSLAIISSERGKLSGDDYDRKITDLVVAPFTDGYTSLHRNLITDIRIIDSTLATQVSNQFQCLQDGFSEFIEKKDVDLDRFHPFLKKQYEETMKILMQYDIRQ